MLRRWRQGTKRENGGWEGKGTYNDTSCFQTGLWAEMRPKRPLERPFEGAVEELAGEGVRVAREVEGDGSLLSLAPVTAAAAAAALEPMAPRAERALEEERGLRATLTAVPLTSLSNSSVGSLETNSFCSNWTTTYGRAWMLRTLSPLAEMSFTWI